MANQDNNSDRETLIRIFFFLDISATQFRFDLATKLQQTCL